MMGYSLVFLLGALAGAYLADKYPVKLVQFKHFINKNFLKKVK